MNGKQRAYLRKIANKLECTFQLGKNDISENIVRQYDDILNTREVVKTNVLKSHENTPREAAEKIAGITGSYVVSVVGRKFVLYRKSEQLEAEGNSIQLP